MSAAFSITARRVLGPAAAHDAMRAGDTFYTYKAGLPELRQTIAAYLPGLYARPVAMERTLRIIDEEIRVAGLEITIPCDAQGNAN